MKKNIAIMLTLCLVFLGGCRKDDKKVAKDSKKRNVEVMEQVNIPIAGDEIKSYFDDSDVNLGEFVLLDDAESDKESENKEVANSADVIAKAVEEKGIDLSDDLDDDDFSWVQEIEEDDRDFEIVYFDFNKHEVREDQQEKVENNSEVAKNLVEEGSDPKIIVEGHSCHSAGSRTYNLALSERRAKAVADRLVANGIPKENIKVVPRGQECPALDEVGNPVSGDKDEQALNRRAAVRVVYS